MVAEVGINTHVSGELDTIVDVTSQSFDGSFRVSVSDPHLRSAVNATMSSAGLVEAGEMTDRTLSITDDVAARGANLVSIVDDTPGTCQQVVEALLSHEIAGIGSRSEISQLPLIVSAAAGSVASVPIRVLQSASRLPKLEDRQRKVLQLLSSGLSNTLIANSLHVSQATVKREVSELLRVFKAGNRLELVMRAAQLGLVDASKIALASDPQN